MNAPTLLVGLGGTGSEIVQKVFERATPSQRKNIGFVIFDTDVNELRVIEERTPQIRTIQTSTRLTVGEYLDCDNYSRDNWFPVNRILNGKALTEGAGQVRAVSRLALNTAIQQGKMAPLNEAIEELYKLKGQKTVQAPRVILAGSLCGGTGSGLILPVAMYIRNFMSSKLQQGSTIIRGFFLLPEVFDGVIRTQSERNNLRSNAYAAVREIDAFMMKDDGSLSERYDLHFMAPRAGSKEQDEYLGRPMDFCFLFDAQNLNGMKLNSFVEYKEHAANCIYGMAIAPTSKRSNSSEDNVIREIVFAGGRNRFAGAGSSMLIYPTEDIKHYLALTWTKESISDEWLEMDRRFADEQRTNRNMRRQGYQVADLNRGDHYIDVIKEGYKERRPFASAIRNLCFTFDANGYVEKNINWKAYVDALDAYLEERVELQREDLTDLLELITTQASAGREKGASTDDFNKWYEYLQGYKKATITCTNTLARNITYSLFKEAKDATKTDDKFRLEYWLRQNQSANSFIHPNAVRFFLYNTINEMKIKEAENRENVKSIEAYWNSFEDKTFKVEDDSDNKRKSSASEYYEAMHLSSDGLKKYWHYRTITEAQSHLQSSFSNLYRNIHEYWIAYVRAEIYHSAIDYLNNLCAAFHDFYDVLDRSIARIDSDIEQMEKKYVSKPGEALRYVCADEECLKGLANDIVNLTSSLDMPSDLNCRIFNCMKSYALTEQKPDAETYFMNAFNSTVVRYLEEQIVSQHSSIVNMDIISALEKEAYYKNPKKKYGLDEQRLYAKKAIENTQLLAKPFIESPVGKEARVIPACAYSTKLATADFPGRRQFVDQCLKEGGGVPDESIDQNMILFYQAVYDIRANELSKFAPPKSAETFDRPGGEYYKAYYELIQNLHPEPQKSKAITPHINRWWHVITKLPDLDEKSQKDQETHIATAFFWGMLSQYIYLDKEDAIHCVYKPDRTALNLKGEEADVRLVVSNGTPCDHLYEVLDAFSIYPKLVDVVCAKYQEQIDSHLSAKRPLRESFLYEKMERFYIDEYEILDENGNQIIRSLFDLPMLMKWSVPAEDYYAENVIQLLDVIFGELRTYLGRFCTKKEFAGVYTELLMKQYARFQKNMKIEIEVQKRGNIYNDALYIYICKAIAAELDSLGSKEQALHVLDELRKQNR